MESEEGEELPIIIDGKAYPNIVKNPLDEISITSFALGALLGLSFAIVPYLRFRNFAIYVGSLATFHFLEYYVTAKFNPGKVHANSFLIRNGSSYFLAHTFAMCEVFLESYFWPGWKSTWASSFHRWAVVLGLICIIFGQYVRTNAMITAGQSFSHIVKTRKNKDHILVKNGIYSWSRHPAYCGYFWWAIGTQLLLLNPISLLLYIVVLWRFFNERIEYEERFLIKFFGKEYHNYKKVVSVGIPFIS
ncbi:HHL262Wp [Eremothecium sinecaudum]|uniref:Protein-S-isoprenylcysteine O-methyltransferase n=1 Tax=Eremothecium sinecaudum TaxID=45286 RepID=A0A0X8HW46_9SACH|nr:HHL262Wp [Eremothecium sinecaudum]AMD22508.1 HHL262Wp [Eremothecium sinecaudum]